MKNRSTHLFSILMVSVFIFLAYASAPDPSAFRKRRKKKVETEESILSNPNLSEEEKEARINKRNAAFEKDRETNTVTAVELAEEYEDNEVRADVNYKNKIFFVDGIIEEIGKDLLNRTYVSLEGVDLFSSVTCYFSSSQDVLDLSKGMNIVIRGRCDGAMLGVDMEHCELIEIIEDQDSISDDGSGI
jgi:hypothetical protein